MSPSVTPEVPSCQQTAGAGCACRVPLCRGEAGTSPVSRGQSPRGQAVREATPMTSLDALVWDPCRPHKKVVFLGKHNPEVDAL